MLARIIEPVSKADSLRVLEEAGLPGSRSASGQLPRGVCACFTPCVARRGIAHDLAGDGIAG